MIENVIPVPRVVCPSCKTVTKVRVRGPVVCENCSRELIVADIRTDYVFVELKHFEELKSGRESLKQEIERLREDNRILRERVAQLEEALRKSIESSGGYERIGAELMDILMREGIPDDLVYLLERTNPALLNVLIELHAKKATNP
ncbi:MAG: hypothetical protein QXP81_01085 [Nitrososphaerota archaeon]